MPISKEELIRLYRTMLTIRRFEEHSYTGYASNAIPGLVHSYIGEEACATGVCAALRREDKIVSTHRGHGHCIAKGADIRRMMAEIYGRSTGLCKGKGGSMHIADFSVGMLGANGIVGGGFGIGVGAALACKLDKSDRVAVVFFGDGATKCKSHLRHPNAHFIDTFTPSAQHMIPLACKAYAEKIFVDTAYFEPFYLKDFIATVPRKNIFG